MSRRRGVGGWRRHWLLWAGGVFACGERPPHPPESIVPGVTVGAPCVESRCTEGLTCRYDLDPQRGKVCALEIGRCRDDWDCARPVQRCRRFGTYLGVCQDAGM
jgi:hypothetical protein